ncbi:hypothetical protein PG987_013503 [Apiospora arundinis]
MIVPGSTLASAAPIWKEG